MMILRKIFYNKSFFQHINIQKHFKQSVQINMQENQIGSVSSDLSSDYSVQTFSQYVFWKNCTYKNQQQQIIENGFKDYIIREGTFKNYTFPYLKLKKRIFESNICVKAINENQEAFKCFDCGYMPTSIYCKQCFEKSNHQGHAYYSFVCSGTGTCDCGDQLSLDSNGFCNKHKKSISAQEIRLLIDQNEYSQFINKMQFCFKFYFNLYFQLKNNLSSIKKKNQNQKQITNEQKNNLMDQFGSSLLQYLIEFNKGSLISNIMTSDLLIKNYYQLQQNNNQTIKRSIFQIIFDLKNVPKTRKQFLILIFSLLTIKQFKYFLAVVYSKKCNQNYQFFQLKTWDDLHCQILTNSQLVKDLVCKKQLKPLKFLPKIDQIKDFQAYVTLVNNYLIRMNYILRLPQQSGEAYFRLYIQQDCLQSLAYHRVISYQFKNSIDHYKIEKNYLQKFSKILKTLSQSQNSLQTLEITISKLFEQILIINQNNLRDFLNQSQSEVKYSQYLYITHQISFALAVFTYFQCLQSSSEIKYDQNAKIQQLIKVLKITFPYYIQYLNIFNMIKVVLNSLNYSGLTLGHQPSAQRYNNYHEMTHNYQNYSTLSPTLYLLEILYKMYNHLKKYHLEQKQMHEYSLEQNLFENSFLSMSLQLVQGFINDQDQFLDDNDSIYDRNKASARLIYFINLLIQAAQTDTNQLIIAMMLGFSEKPKYSQMALKFYLQVLKVQKKINLKDFKKIVDKFFVSDDLFENFITKSKDIFIHNGKLILKQYIEEQNNLKRMHESKQKEVNHINKVPSSKISSEINIYYFPSFKYKIQAMITNLNGLKVPISTNHFLSDIFSEKYIDQLCQIVFSYGQKIYQRQGKVRQRQTGSLNQLIVQVIKIGKALKLSAPSDLRYIKILQLLHNMHESQSYLSILSQQIKMMIIQQIQHTQQSQKQMNLLQKDKQKKAEQLKNKLKQKKNKKLQKFKKNYQIYDQKYEKQLENIKELLDIQQNQLKEQSENQFKKCLICCENQNIAQQKQYYTTKKSKLCIMVYIQKTDLYYEFIKGKKQNYCNSHLVFKTCGHYIHEACSKKIKINKDYPICQLCKSPFNFLLPINIINFDEKLFKENIKIFYQEFQMKFNQLLIIQQQLDPKNSNKSLQFPQVSQSIQQKILQGIINQIIFSFILDKKYSKQKFQKDYYKFFDRKQISLYKLLLKGLKIINLYKFYQSEQLKNQQSQTLKGFKQLKQQDQIFSKQQQQNISQHIPTLLKRKTSFLPYIQAIQMYIKQSFQNYFYNKKQEIKTKYNFDKSDFRMLKQLLNNLIYQDKQLNVNKIVAEEQCMSIQIIQNQSNLIKRPLQFYRPPPNFKQFLYEFKKCPNCLEASDQIFICFICSWKGCKQCKKIPIFQHTNTKHNSSSIYISMYRGTIYYVSKNKFWIFPSIYQNYLGIPLLSYERGFKKEKFILNETKLKKIYKNILNYDIFASIKYQQLIQNKHYPYNL